MNELIYGKNNLDRIVSIEPGETTAEIFRELEDGSIESLTVPIIYYLLYGYQYSPKFKRLSGDQPFRWIYEAASRTKFREILSASYRSKYDFHVIRDAKEMVMVRDGYTHFKGMKTEDVSVLSFDIETTGLTHDDSSKVLLISNTFRRKGKIERKLFSLDEYESQADMLAHWCLWVQGMNPSIILGHNIYGFDLPYIQYVASRENVPLNLGRNGSAIQFADRTSQKRKDGSQSYDYTNALIYGREIVDTYFLALNFDIGRKYESYGLKQIIAQEGLERKGRQHYDAGQISKDWPDLEKRKKIKAYAIDDADDALKLYDLMIPSFFYYTQSIPRSFQAVINSASGSQLNSVMIRAYLQQGHSIARGSEAAENDGAISFGNPGVYKNVLRFDVASLYPSIMLQYKIYSKEKDPQALSLKILEYFTTERLANKKKGKETGDRYYKDLEQSQKIVINSVYGFLNAPKLNYNFPPGGDKVCLEGRRIICRSAEFLGGRGQLEIIARKFVDCKFILGAALKETKNFIIAAGDTDGLAFCKTDQKAFTSEEETQLLQELNSLMDSKIRWESDGQVKKQIVIKTKNYILQDEKGNVKIKGSALKATTKEKALQRFLKETIDLLLKDRKDRMFFLYQKYANEIMNLEKIDDWCVKKTVTKAVLNGTRTNETRVLDALEESDANEGDKVYMFFRTPEELCLREHFDGTYDIERLLQKLFKTLEIFDTVIDVSLFPNLTLKRNLDLLPSRAATPGFNGPSLPLAPIGVMLNRVSS